MELRGKGALITGASKGLGAALAEELARSGARVALVARGADELARVAARIRASGGEAHNASTLGSVPLRPLLDTDCEDLDRVLEVNLVGPFRLTKIVAGAMALRGSGLVVHVSSDAAVAAYPRWGAYGVSKAALDHLGRIFAAELGAAGVRFLSVDPGEMDTEMHAAAMPDADRAALPRPEVVARRIARMIRESERIEGGARLEANAWAEQR